MKKLSLSILVVLSLITFAAAPAAAQGGVAAAAPAAAAHPAAAPAAAPTTTPPCKIGTITAGGVVEAGKATSIPFAMKTANCTDVTEVTGDELVFTDFEFNDTTGVVTGRIKANTNAGVTVSLKVKNAGVEVASPKSVYVLVLNPDGVFIRNEAATAIAKANRNAAAANKAAATLKTELATAATAVAKRAEEVREELNRAVALRPTSSEIQTLLDKALDSVKKDVADLKVVTTDHGKRIGGSEKVAGELAGAIVNLAQGQATLANRKTGGVLGFGKKATDPEVAAAAERIQRAVEDAFRK